MKQFLSLVIKEAKHIVRDKRTMLMLFGMPIVLMLLFGFAITNDVKNVRTVIVTSRANYATQQAVDRLSASAYFTITRAVATPAEGPPTHSRPESRPGPWCFLHISRVFDLTISSLSTAQTPTWHNNGRPMPARC